MENRNIAEEMADTIDELFGYCRGREVGEPEPIGEGLVGFKVTDKRGNTTQFIAEEGMFDLICDVISLNPDAFVDEDDNEDADDDIKEVIYNEDYVESYQDYIVACALYEALLKLRKEADEHKEEHKDDPDEYDTVLWYEAMTFVVPVHLNQMMQRLTELFKCEIDIINYKEFYYLLLDVAMGDGDLIEYIGTIMEHFLVIWDEKSLEV